MVKIVQNLCSPSNYNIKCPFKIKPEYITIHNTANDASAKNEIAYMIRNNHETSFHYAVDDIEAVQGLPLDRNGWHAGDGQGPGNMKSIAIEICYSKSGGPRFEKAMENAAELTAMLLKQFCLGINSIKKHQDWSGKYCPHRILSDYGWNYYLNLVNKYFMGNSPTPEINPILNYQTHDNVKNQWLPNVQNTTDYAGNYKNDVDALYIEFNKGNVYYKVHTTCGKWLPEVKNRNDYAGNYNQSVDAVMIKLDNGYKAKYRVHLRDKNEWLDYVDGYDESDWRNGYAGNYGDIIDAIQMYPVSNSNKEVIKDTPEIEKPHTEPATPPKQEVVKPVEPKPEIKEPIEEVKPTKPVEPIVPKPDEKPIEPEVVAPDKVEEKEPEQPTTQSLVRKLFEAIINLIMSLFNRHKEK